MPLTARFSAALEYACRLHATQVRKGSGVPYIAHLLSVAALAIEHGADEDEAIAAVLHDAVEDQGGAATAAEIRTQFGPRVAAIVEACSDTDMEPKPPWRERKEAYLAHLATADRSVRLVSAADKLHNVRSLLDDYRTHGEDVWSRFNGGRDGTLWYYRTVADILAAAESNRLIAELLRVVAELERLTGRDI